MLIQVITIAVLGAGIGVSRAQDPPPPPPPQSQTAPQTQTPPASQTQAPVTLPVAAPAAAPAAALPPLTREQIQERRSAIFMMEGSLMKAVMLAAQNTATEIRRVEPNIVMFSAAPVKAHGTYLETYGVFFQVEIPSVIPSVASLVETIARDRMARPNPNPARPAALTGSPSSEALMNPDAHYVESVKQRLIDVMVRLSNSLELRPDEWLTVEARDGSEAPGQLAQPSTMNLRIRGSDLADFFAGRITLEEARKRVDVRAF